MSPAHNPPPPCPCALLLQHVTFVSGTNGSGKSAVLQALQCCLGVKASNTGRANSFKKVRAHMSSPGGLLWGLSRACAI